MQLIHIFFALFILTCATSCALNQKVLAPNQTIYRVDQNGGSQYEINAYRSNSAMKVKIEESGNKLLIQKSSTELNNFAVHAKVRNASALPGTHLSLNNGKFYFSESTFPQANDASFSNMAFQGPEKIKYHEDKLVLQALSIPLKFRPVINTLRYKDSLPAFVETGFNAGIATGIKRTWTTYNSTQINSLGSNYSRISIAAGPLFNIGGTDVKKTTTDYTINFDRKEAYYSYGLFFLVGFNNINLGYSIGEDRLFSSRNKNWIYSGRVWHGITIALDILK